MSTCLLDGDWVETEDTWYGFSNGFHVRTPQVELQLSRSTAPLWEGERPHPIKVELVGESDWPLIILSSSEKEFVEGPINTAFRNYQSLVPDTSIILEAPGIQEPCCLPQKRDCFYRTVKYFNLYRIHIQRGIQRSTHGSCVGR